jgi:hypothetical protein
MTKLIIAFCNFTNVSKSGWSTTANFIGVLSIGFIAFSESLDPLYGISTLSKANAM